MPLSWRSASRSSSPAAVRASSPSPAASRISTHGREQPQPAERVRGLGERAADRARGGLAAPLGEPQQGEAGLRLEAAAARVAVGLLGRGELPAHAVDLALAIDRVAGRDRDRAEALAGAPRLLERHLPVARQLQDLGAVDQADAGVGDHLGLAARTTRRAPSVHSRARRSSSASWQNAIVLQ